LSETGHRAGLWLGGFVWGLAEATFFFVVPDVLLTFVSQRRGLLSALMTMVFVVTGAVLGGLAMWWVGGAYPETVTVFLDRFPAISRSMIDEAAADQAREPFKALLAGAFSGVPYKVFAATAQTAGVSAAWFLLITIPARAVRFLIAIIVTIIIEDFATRRFSSRARLRILAAFWVVFYAAFWAAMPS
jgi:membrane protein YqaA with SNARE-associated domain